MQLEDRNLADILQGWAIANPDAISVEQQGKRYTRSDILSSAGALSGVLGELGIQQGASVAVLVGDPLRGIETAMALWSLGASVLFLDPRQPAQEIARCKEQAGIDAVLTDIPRFSKKLGAQILPGRSDLVEFRGEMRFSKDAHLQDALILSSSGTTGTPKFRRVSHQKFVHNMDTAARLVGNPVPFPSVLTGSLAFGAVLGHWLRVLMHGQFVLSLPMFARLEDLHEALLRPEIQAVGLPPVLIRDLLAFQDRLDQTLPRPLYPHIRRMISVGGPISPQDLVRAYQVLTPGVKNLYSLTGVGSVSILEGSEILTKRTSVGKPLEHVTVRIEDQDGQGLPPGQTGRIIARADWKPDAEFTDTGDLGWMDQDGYLFVAGRGAQIASRNSVNISIADLETDVRNLPEVRDCLAFSIPSDGSPDDTVCLAVETQADEQTIRKRLRELLAGYKRPDRLLVAERLPRSAADKILLRELREAAEKKENSFVEF